MTAQGLQPVHVIGGGLAGSEPAWQLAPTGVAVDRDGFSAAVEKALAGHPLITIAREEIAGLPPADWRSVIVATGPLTSPALADDLRALTGEESLAFFDAIAPIVHRETINMDI